MSRWRWGWIFIGILAIVVVLSRSSYNGLLKDSDTILILNGIQARGAPLSWFGSDWPLGNHFYRPVVTLLFEANLALTGKNPAGFALTNALLGAFSILALFWFLRELTDRLSLSVLGAGLFGFWHLVGRDPHVDWIGYGVMGLSLVALALPGRPRLPALLSLCLGLALVYELASIAPFRRGIIEWIPGRTASTMTFFCLVAMAAYARSVRVGLPPTASEPGPLDPPATKGSSRLSGGSPWPWVALSLVCAALAMGSYEQAIMLPSLLIGVAVTMKMRRFQIHWGPHIGFWLLVILYTTIRNIVVPAGVSDYQAQQFRSSAAVFLTLCDYVFPAARDAVNLMRSLDIGFFGVLTTQVGAILAILGNIGLVWGLVGKVKEGLARVDRTLAATLMFGFAGSVLAFLPMAFLKPFDTYNHYHYWSVALRSAFVAGLLIVVGEWLTCALSPRALQAPKRLAPAPGSLPHP